MDFSPSAEGATLEKIMDSARKGPRVLKLALAWLINSGMRTFCRPCRELAERDLARRAKRSHAVTEELCISSLMLCVRLPGSCQCGRARSQTLPLSWLLSSGLLRCVPPWLERYIGSRSALLHILSVWIAFALRYRLALVSRLWATLAHAVGCLSGAWLKMTSRTWF